MMPNLIKFPSLDLEASFSYGSSDEEDERPTLVKNESHSFRLNIRKGIKDRSSIEPSASRDDEDFSRLDLEALKEDLLRKQKSLTEWGEKLPLSRREKLKKSIKLTRDDEARSHALRRGNSEIIHVNDYYDSTRSWRSKSARFVRNDGMNMTPSIDETKAMKADTTMSEGNSSDVRFVSNNLKSNSETVKVSEKAMKKYFLNCLEAMDCEEWQIVEQNIQSVTGLISYQSPKHEKRNLLHIIAMKQNQAPRIFYQNIVKIGKDALMRPDVHGNVPLHYAASVSCSEDVVGAYLGGWKGAASARNIDGDMPLHVAAWTESSNPVIVDALLATFPQALIAPNNSGATPLHLACCGSSSSSAIVNSLLKVCVQMSYPAHSSDINGNSPLHVAIKTHAPIKVLESFKENLGESPFQLVNEEGMNSVHIALAGNNPDVDTIYYLCHVSLKMIKVPLPNGTMPALLAAQKGMPHPLVKKLLLADMPVLFGTQNFRELNDVVLRTHSYSWWHMATLHGEYAPIFDDILNHIASLQEICALAQETNPDGFFCLFEKANANIREVFKKNLKFGERYEVIATFRCLITDGLLKVCALDWGDRIGWEELCSNNDPHMVENGYIAVTSEGRDTEVVYYARPQREVVLHCCVKDSDQYDKLLEEMYARRKFNFSHLDTQRIYNVHTFDAKKIGCVGEMLCVSFERPLLTLADVFETSRFRRRKNVAWARKTWNLLKRLAQVLNYFHSVGFVHGHVNPRTIAKFDGSNNWKLTDLRHSVEIGSPMKAELHLGAPPESVISSSLQSAGSQDGLRSVSFDENFSRTKAINYEVSLDCDDLSLEFSPQSCIAEPSWDVYSFGLVMGQLILGQSMVFLPNFEHSRDAHLKNLYHYDDIALKKIGDAALRVSNWEAADLLLQCLQVLPEDRPKSMEEILAHPYFDE